MWRRIDVLNLRMKAFRRLAFENSCNSSGISQNPLLSCPPQARKQDTRPDELDQKGARESTGHPTKDHKRIGGHRGDRGHCSQ